MPTGYRVLFVTRACYLDDSNGAAVSSRELMQALARMGFLCEVLCGAKLDLDQDFVTSQWLAKRGYLAEELGGDTIVLDALGARAEVPAHLRLVIQGVPLTLHRGSITPHHEPDEAECSEFLHLYETLLERFRPNLVIGYGGSRLQGEVFAKARTHGSGTLFNLHNCRYSSTAPFAHVDAIRVPSRFAAGFYRESLGLDCTVLPNFIDVDRVRVTRHEPQYVTFVNPSMEKGVYVFARIADELGRRRPDIPILVVEARGDERHVADCGLDLRARGNVFFMSHTSDPRLFYRVSRLLLVPSLVPETFGRVAAEAMCNGIPVLASNRGALPETLGIAGVVLPLPDRLTPVTRLLPTAAEVVPWIQTIIRFWDDPVLYEEYSRKARHESRQWHFGELEGRYSEFLQTRFGIVAG